MEEINKIIDKSTKMIDLLKELRASVEADKCKYVVKFEYWLGEDRVFSLYDNEANKLIMLDKPSRIESYLKVRGVSEENIYKHFNS